ncbi:MAG: hypothetical protein ABIT07_02230 [Ferruginibacter sp.]
MQVFFKRVLIFLLPFILAALFLEIYLRQITTSYQVKENGLLSGIKNIELLITGNSHAAFGIDPAQFNLNAYTIAQVNQSLYFDKRLTLKHLDSLKALKFVFIILDFHSLYFSSQDYRDNLSYYAYGINYKNRVSNLAKISRLKGYPLKVASSYIKRDWSKKYTKIGAVDVEDGVDLNRSIIKGWYSYAGTDQYGMSSNYCETRANDFNLLVRVSKEKTAILKDLEDFIHQLMARNITPVLITTPSYEPYRKKLNKKFLGQNETDIRNLSLKFNLEYWNYFEAPLSENDFYDCDHLNYNGAIKFSKLLNQRLETTFKVSTHSN